jgi:hypothetical protein
MSAWWIAGYAGRQTTIPTLQEATPQVTRQAMRLETRLVAERQAVAPVEEGTVVAVEAVVVQVQAEEVLVGRAVEAAVEAVEVHKEVQQENVRNPGCAMTGNRAHSTIRRRGSAMMRMPAAPSWTSRRQSRTASISLHASTA